MPSIRDYPATALAAVLSVLWFTYALLTPTNIVLLGLVPILLLLGLGLLVDRLLDDSSD
ncbi:hypothetical protein GCM10028857_09900 [Salinarchaeum chitinilyticum]